MNPPEQQSQQMYIDGIQSMYQIRDTKLRYIKYNLQTEDLYSSNISVKKHPHFLHNTCQLDHQSFYHLTLEKLLPYPKLACY